MFITIFFKKSQYAKGMIFYNVFFLEKLGKKY